MGKYIFHNKNVDTCAELFAQLGEKA